MRQREGRIHREACALASTAGILALLAGAARAQQYLPGQRYPLGGCGDGAGAAADFDADGRPDIATANVCSDDVAVAFGDGAGGFVSPQLLGVGEGPVAIAVADFEANGTADIATANQDSDNVSVLAGLGNGGFRPPVMLPVGQSPQDIEAADVDLDGDMDLVTADYKSRQVSALLNTGAGVFAPAQSTSVFAVKPRRLDAGDLDADGDVDLAIAGGEAKYASLVVLYGDGSGGFGAPGAEPPPSSATEATIADVDGDGSLDLVAPPCPSFCSQLSLVLGQGSGGFGPMMAIDTASTPVSVACADVDGDGLPDLLTANDDYPWSAYAGSVSVLLAMAPAIFAAHDTMAAGGANRFIAVLDTNGDGWLDLVTPNGGSDVTVLVAAGAGTFLGAVLATAGSAYTDDLGTADFDSDGLNDVLTCGYEASILLSTAEGGFEEAGDYAGPSDWIARAVAVGDLDGDAAIDSVTCGWLGDVTAFRNDGLGGFASVSPYAVSTDLRDVELGDMNLDGWPDVVTIDPQGSVWVLLNDTSGGLLPAAGFAVGKPAFALVVADVNADGGLDAVVEKTGTMAPKASHVTVLPGNNAGAFHPPVTTPLSPEQTGMAVSDVDGDGLPDLVTASAELIEIRPGDGSGSFGAPIQSIEGASKELEFADLNGDGRADLISAAGTSALVWLGAGTGLEPALEYSVAANPSTAAVADISGDGAPEMLVSGNEVNEFGGSYLSLLRGLSPGWAWSKLGAGLAGAHGVPLLEGSGALVAGQGVKLTLDHALESSVAALVVGLSAVNLPFKGGVLVPEADIVFLAIPTGPRGQITLSSPWPALTPPGFKVYFQYWIADAAAAQGFSASNAAVCTSP